MRFAGRIRRTPVGGEEGMENAYRELLELCRVPSVSGTDGERAMAELIYGMLRRMDCFSSQRESPGLCPMPEDALGRSFVCALLEGKRKSPRTVILLSHFDVVSAADYGEAENLAFDPEGYTARLRERNGETLPPEAREDLLTGNYLFGRGVMDMKFGVAAHLDLLRRAGRELDGMEGNLLFLSVPDEEANSAGMLAAVRTLEELKQKRGLEYILCLVSEPSFPRYPGDTGRYLYTGTMGKLLPVFYCVGRETHAGEPLSGLNPNLLTAKIVEKLESQPRWSDEADGVWAPPPVCLKQADLKREYSVQTPEEAYAYFNMITLRKTPEQVMGDMLEVARNAMNEAVEERKKHAELWSRRTGFPVSLPEETPRALTYPELFRWCEAAGGDAFRTRMRELKQSALPEERDLRLRSLRLVREVCRFCPDPSPKIVVFFAPPYYPHSPAPEPGGVASRLCRLLGREAREKYGAELAREPFFPGLSDMSYLGLPKEVNAKELAGHFPLWGGGYQIPLETMAELNVPVLNLGPRGKDAHRFTERLCLPDAFEITLPLLWSAVRRLLWDTDRAGPGGQSPAAGNNLSDLDVC